MSIATAPVASNLLAPHFVDDLVRIDADKFASHVDLAPFGIEHDLPNHPLFQLESLIELSQRLPAHLREYVFGKQEFGTHECSPLVHATENDERSTEDLIRCIEDQNMVVVLRNVETDPIYGEFVNDCLDSLSRFVEPITGPMSGRESFIFISPPNGYTPYHWDPEQNFFMQVKGKKQMAVYDPMDRQLLPDASLETYFNEDQTVTKCDEAMFDQYELFEMDPGDGVYVPFTAPHWVKTLDEVSISVSVNFRTPTTVRRDRVYRMNRLLRRVGWSPAPVTPRADQWNERVKSAIMELPARIKKLSR